LGDEDRARALEAERLRATPPKTHRAGVPSSAAERNRQRLADALGVPDNYEPPRRQMPKRV